MYGLEQQVLHTDVTGMPLEWINYQQAVRLLHAEQVAYTCGMVLYTVHGGVNARSGQTQRAIAVNSIIATRGGAYARLRARRDYVPPLSNAALFRRDCNTCLYCGETFAIRDLSRDHVKPLVQGGAIAGTTWSPPASPATTARAARPRNRPECSYWRFRSPPITPNTCICRASGYWPIRWIFSALTFLAPARCTSGWHDCPDLARRCAMTDGQGFLHEVYSAFNGIAAFAQHHLAEHPFAPGAAGVAAGGHRAGGGRQRAAHPAGRQLRRKAAGCGGNGAAP
jgi:5-methylcytosine-specific restriction endonuclease McrA